jgi:uncharacterized protein (DUF2141 family)
MTNDQLQYPMKIATIISLVLLVFPAFPQNLTIEISGIKNDKGLIQLSVYRDKETFADETPFHIYNFNKEKMVEGKMTVIIPDLPSGIYGIALIDDKNENGKMDYHLFFPCEGFGFSNYYFKGSRKPEFESFAFQISGEYLTVRINVQYF